MIMLLPAMAWTLSAAFVGSSMVEMAGKFHLVMPREYPVKISSPEQSGYACCFMGSNSLPIKTA